MTRPTAPSSPGVIRAVLLGLLGATLLAAAGCRGDRSDAPPRRFFPDMDDQYRWDPQEQTDLYSNERTLRDRVEGTVAYASWPIDPADQGAAPWAGSWVEERAGYLAESSAVYRGRDEDGVYLRVMPVEVTRELIEAGRVDFNTYCAACHGYTGDGRGTVGRQWGGIVSNLMDDVYANRDDEAGKGSDGYLFHVVLNGVYNDPADIGDNSKLRMPGYAHAIDERGAWAVVAYIRALQKTGRATIADIDDPAKRETFERQQREAQQQAAGEEGAGA